MGQATKVVAKGDWSKDGNLYEVETGRRDGSVSSAKEAVKNLPDSFDGIRKLIKRFASKNLSLKDLAVLSGINLHLVEKWYFQILGLLTIQPICKRACTYIALLAYCTLKKHGTIAY
jgi:hypothetical protein